MKHLAAAVLGEAALTPSAEAARAHLVSIGGWLTDTTVTTPPARSGWAQVDPRWATMIRYAASDVLDTAALAVALPPAPPAGLARERAVQHLTARLTLTGLSLDATRITALLTEHTAARVQAAGRVVAHGIDNPGSDPQVGEVLTTLGAERPVTQTGRPSVSVGALAPLRDTPGAVGGSSSSSRLTHTTEPSVGRVGRVAAPTIDQTAAVRTTRHETTGQPVEGRRGDRAYNDRKVTDMGRLWDVFTGENDPHETNEQEVTAWHEASHARMASARGNWRVREMWAAGDAGGTYVETGHDREDKLTAHLLTCVAGQAGAMRYYVTKGYSTREARRLAEEGTGSDRAAFAAAAAGTTYRWDDLLDEAYRFVRRHEYTIETNAKPLARRGRRGGTWA